VGRFLEHSRIYLFGERGEAAAYLSSADWMPRNFDRRVEVAFPIDEPELKKRLTDDIRTSLSDTEKLRVLHPDGTYARVDGAGRRRLNSHEEFYERARADYAKTREKPVEEMFVPIRGELAEE
jgi:polyphosphate kinase